MMPMKEIINQRVYLEIRGGNPNIIKSCLGIEYRRCKMTNLSMLLEMRFVNLFTCLIHANFNVMRLEEMHNT